VNREVQFKVSIAVYSLLDCDAYCWIIRGYKVSRSYRLYPPRRLLGVTTTGIGILRKYCWNIVQICNNLSCKKALHGIIHLLLQLALQPLVGFGLLGIIHLQYIIRMQLVPGNELIETTHDNLCTWTWHVRTSTRLRCELPACHSTAT
jgi:hypothetical protein